MMLLPAMTPTKSDGAAAASANSDRDSNSDSDSDTDTDTDTNTNTNTNTNTETGQSRNRPQITTRKPYYTRKTVYKSSGDESEINDDGAAYDENDDDLVPEDDKD